MYISLGVNLQPRICCDIPVVAVEFIYSIKTRQRFNNHSKFAVRVSTSFTSLSHTEGTSTVAITSK